MKIIGKPKIGLALGGGSVILDASFSKAKKRLKAKELATKTGADFIVIECTLNEEILRERLTKRQERRSISDARQDVLQLQKRLFEPLVGVPDEHHVVVDTSQSIDRLLEKIETVSSHSYC